MSEILKSENECAYCGWTGDTRDHVPALSNYWLGKRDRASGLHNNKHMDKTVPACRECNMLLSNLHINSIRGRAEYLSEVIQKRYAKRLSQPVWSEDEIEEMGEEMKRFIRAKSVERQIVIDRLSHLGQISRWGAETVKEYRERVLDPSETPETLEYLSDDFESPSRAS